MAHRLKPVGCPRMGRSRTGHPTRPPTLFGDRGGRRSVPTQTPWLVWMGSVLPVGIAFLAGVTAVLALPPYSLLPIAPVAFGALFWLVRDCRPLGAILLGWFFGLGFFAAGLSWIMESFQVDADRFGALALPAVAGLSAFLAVFPALACGFLAILSKTWIGAGPRAAVAFAASWVLAEWLRGHVLTGFPWNLAAYVLVEFAELRQLAAWFGSYGVSFLVVLAAVLPAQAIALRTHGRSLSTVLLIVVLGGSWVAGTLRLSHAVPSTHDISLRIVQGNVPQQEKWRPENREPTVARYLALSAAGGPVDLILWPETAYPGYLDETPKVRERIAAALPKGAVLLTGVPDRALHDPGPVYYNAVQAYDDTGALLARYSKHHLVPFGEYVPFDGWLPIERMTSGLGDFSPGPGPHTINLPGLPSVAVAICYEIIFPGNVVDQSNRPDWIFNATNDAWFGTSVGPEQHLAAARMRAVEEGLPVIRAANTGISAVIDVRGDVLARLDLEATGAIDADLPPPLSPTLYATFGDVLIIPLILSVLAIVSALMAASSGRGQAARQPNLRKG